MGGTGGGRPSQVFRLKRTVLRGGDRGAVAAPALVSTVILGKSPLCLGLQFSIANPEGVSVVFQLFPSPRVSVRSERSPGACPHIPEGSVSGVLGGFLAEEEPEAVPLAASSVGLSQPRWVPLFAPPNKGIGSILVADESVCGLWIINRLTRFFCVLIKLFTLLSPGFVSRHKLGQTKGQLILEEPFGKKCLRRGIVLFIRPLKVHFTLKKCAIVVRI